MGVSGSNGEHRSNRGKNIVLINISNGKGGGKTQGGEVIGGYAKKEWITPEQNPPEKVYHRS